jgi:hypothetical protein
MCGIERFKWGDKLHEKAEYVGWFNTGWAFVVTYLVWINFASLAR